MDWFNSLAYVYKPTFSVVPENIVLRKVSVNKVADIVQINLDKTCF